MQTEKLSNYKVVAKKLKSSSITTWKGSELFDYIYASIYIIAKRKSGKTQLIYNILEECTDPSVHVVIFSGTSHKDDTYIEMIKWLKSQGNQVSVYDSIFEGKTDLLKEFIDGKLKFGGSEEKKKDKKKIKKKDLAKEEKKLDMSKFEKYNIDLGAMMFGGLYKPLKYNEKPEIKEEKIIPKKQVKNKNSAVPKYIFIFDDLSAELKTPSVSAFVKQARHEKALCIFSSQYVNDLQPQTIKNMEVIILFGGHSIDKLEEVHKHADLSISLDDFVDAYEYATEEKYNFLYIDVVNEKLRKNFDILIKIE